MDTAVTSVRFGGPENGHLSYSAIGTWAENHQYKLIAPGREVFIVPPKPGHESSKNSTSQQLPRARCGAKS